MDFVGAANESGRFWHKRKTFSIKELLLGGTTWDRQENRTFSDARTNSFLRLWHVVAIRISSLIRGIISLATLS